MKKSIILITTFLTFLFFSSNLFAQERFELNGTFEGKHIEFYGKPEVDSLVFFYKFELQTDSNKVSGKSYVYNEDGYYAVVNVRGFISGDKFFFEEYNTIDEINPKEQPWCYNSGHLDITKEKGVIHLKGFTKSYTKSYGSFCRIGSTDLMKTSVPEDDFLDEDVIPVAMLDYQPFVSPNPTQGETSIEFNMLQSGQVIIEVYDISGELMEEVVRRTLFPGKHTFTFDLSFERDGMYVVELAVGEKLYTTELWKGLQ